MSSYSRFHYIRSCYNRFFSRQARHPKGLFGRFFMSRIFNKGNVRLNGFVRECLDLRNGEKALEIGYGTGFLIQSLADKGDACEIHGIDSSAAMADLARKKNREHIRAGRVCLRHGNFDGEPYAPGSFDCVFTVNTIYFWKTPEQTLEKIHGMLKPGGRLVIGFHGKADMQKKALDTEVFTYYTTQDVADLLSGNFSRVDIREKKEVDFTCYCAVGIR